MKTGWPGSGGREVDLRRLISLLAAAVVVAGVELFVWYVLV